jgi:hypothetical protein
MSYELGKKRYGSIDDATIEIDNKKIILSEIIDEFINSKTKNENLDKLIKESKNFTNKKDNKNMQTIPNSRFALLEILGEKNENNSIS